MLVLVDELPRTAGTKKLQRVGFAAKIGLTAISGTSLAFFSAEASGLTSPSIDVPKLDALLRASASGVTSSAFFSLPPAAAPAKAKKQVSLDIESSPKAPPPAATHVCFVTPAAANDALLHAYLGVSLPDHAIPTRVIAVDILPTTDAEAATLADAVAAGDDGAIDADGSAGKAVSALDLQPADSLSRIVFSEGRSLPVDYVMMSHLCNQPESNRDLGWSGSGV